jgi:hypothetical protein
MDNVIKQTELSMVSRVFRLFAGSIFIGIVMSSSGELGYLTLLPLLAIYPIITGIIGEDPLDSLFANWQGGFGGECFRPSSRIALMAVGGVAIGVMMLSPENVGLRAFLALVSVYPILSGLFGEDLSTTALGLGRKTSEEVGSEQSVRLVHSANVNIGGSTPVRKFGHGAGPKAA